jgi:hypothetical protein
MTTGPQMFMAIFAKYDQGSMKPFGEFVRKVEPYDPSKSMVVLTLLATNAFKVA